MEAENARSEFKSHFARLRYLHDIADQSLAEFYYEQHMECVKFLARKFRKGNDFVTVNKSSVVLSGADK